MVIDQENDCIPCVEVPVRSRMKDFFAFEAGKAQNCS